MAESVIVVGTKRGNQHVSLAEISQMCGRAGRRHGGLDCFAHIIVEEDREEEIRQGMESSSGFNVMSSFSDADSLSFHVMPEIASGRIVNQQDLKEWIGRSLYGHLGGNSELCHDVVSDLLKCEAIVIAPGGNIVATKIGEIAAYLYFHPGDVKSWKDNFTRVFDLAVENETAAIAWALGTRTHSKCRGDFDDRRFIIDEYRSALPVGLDIERGTIIQTVLWWCSMGGPPAGKLRNQMLELRDDIGRIVRALDRLDREVTHWNRDSFFDDMKLMVSRGIRPELLDLCKIPGITKGRADYLYNKGVFSVEDIAEKISSFEDELDDQFLMTLRSLVNEFRSKSR